MVDHAENLCCSPDEAAGIIRDADLFDQEERAQLERDAAREAYLRKATAGESSTLFEGLYDEIEKDNIEALRFYAEYIGEIRRVREAFRNDDVIVRLADEIVNAVRQKLVSTQREIEERRKCRRIN